MTKLEEIAIALSGEEQTRMVSAYATSTEGLYVHRQLIWVPAASEHKFTSKWTITHKPTGKSLLYPSLGLLTMHEAVALCERLRYFDWTTKEPPMGGYKAVMEEYRRACDNKAAPSVDSTPARFVIRKLEASYGVVDTTTDVVVETHVHRGIASSAARALNEKESV